MDVRQINTELSVSGQITPLDIDTLKNMGFKAIICNRPDREGEGQPLFSQIETAARQAGLNAYYLPAQSGKVTEEHAREFGKLVAESPKPILAFCRTGMRSTTMWDLSQSSKMPPSDIIAAAGNAGFDMNGMVSSANPSGVQSKVAEAAHDIVIVGGGAAGIAAASSLLARHPGLNIAIIDPADVHYYQPGWTLVGGGVFDSSRTVRPMKSLIPQGVNWIKSAVAAFEPETNAVILDGNRTVKYKQLIVCPGLKLDWKAIEGLSETLGRNGVTSNYLFHLAPYTWELVRSLRSGKALFTQPPMPIKCAGAPQKAMYLSADQWRRSHVLDKIDVEFYNSGGVLFGVPEYVPALMEYVKAYEIQLNFQHTLVAVDGPARIATFERTGKDGSKDIIKKTFDMMHVVPPQKAPDFISLSPLADSIGWVNVDPATMRHKSYENVFALGDVTNTPNAKTAAAARVQAPVVAHNVLSALGHTKGQAAYNGYGSCPLTVERGKIVLAEFLYGGKVAPTFPKWLLDGTQPSRLAWMLKEHVLPPLYWEAMLKGREWGVKPELADARS